MSEKRYIQSIERASTILNYIAQSQTAKLQDICQATNLKKTTAFGILQTLEHTGQIIRTHDGTGYTLGLQSLNLGLSYLKGSSMTKRVRELLAALVEEIDETAYFVLKVGDSYYYSDFVVSTQPLKVVPDSNRFYEYPEYSALGQVFFNSDPNFKYGLDLEMVYQGVNCIAIPYYTNGETVASVILTGPSSRYTKEKMEETYEKYIEIMKKLKLEKHLHS